MIQYPAVWTRSCSFSTAFWLPNIRKENLLTPGCIMAPNCLCIKPCCLEAPSRSSKPTMASSRSPLKPTELLCSFVFWLPVLFFCIESCLWKTLFPSAFSSLPLENELDLSSIVFWVLPLLFVAERSVSCSGGAARWTRGDAPSALRSLDGFLMSFKLLCAPLCLQCEDCKLRRRAWEPGGSGFLGYRHLPTAGAPAAQRLLPGLGSHGGTAVNWHTLLHLIYIMWLTIASPHHPTPLLSLIFITHGEGNQTLQPVHVLFFSFFLMKIIASIFPFIVVCWFLCPAEWGAIKGDNTVKQAAESVFLQFPAHMLKQVEHLVNIRR